MLPRSVEQVFNVKSIAPAGLRLDQLKPYQLGILDERTQLTIASPTGKRDQKWRWVWKSPSTGNSGSFPDKNNVKAPIQSLPVSYIDKVTGFFEPTAERKTFEGYLGWDGISACDSLGPFECGTTYQLMLHASGKPVRDLLGRDYTEIVPFTTGCCDNCTGDEAITATLKTIQDSFLTNAHYIKNFFDVHQVRSCCPAEDPFTETTFTDYCVTVCDNGDASALGDVQNYYPTLNGIYRSGRADGKSTYTIECQSSQPAAYVTTDTVLQNCDTCPSGFTAVPARLKYIITINNDGTGDTAAEWLAEVQAVATYSTAVAATRLSYTNGTSIYEVLLPIAFTEPANPVANTTWQYIATVPASCTQTTPVSTAWASCGTKKKLTRTMCITVKNGDCDDAQADLDAITAYMASVPNLVADSLEQETAGDCISRYTVQQYSSCYEDGCDWLGGDLAKFEDLPGYLGASWAPCKCEGWTFEDGCPVEPTPVDPADCRGGLKFVGKNFDADIVACTDDYWQMDETEFAQLEVSITQYNNNGCNTINVPWTVVQRGSTPQGTGRQLWKREIQARNYSAYDYHGANSQDGNLFAARRGEVYSIDPAKLYNTITVHHVYERPRYAQNSDAGTRQVITFAVEQNKLTLLSQLKTLLNDITESMGNGTFL